MKLFLLSFFLLFTTSILQAQGEPVLDTVATVKAQKALEDAEILFSKEHINYAKAALELSSLYMHIPDLLIDWEDMAMDALKKIRQEEGPESDLYAWALERLPSPIDDLYDSQLDLEEAALTKASNPARYAKALFQRAKVFFEDNDLEAYDMLAWGIQTANRLPQQQREELMAYPRGYANPYILQLCATKAAMDNVLQAPPVDSLVAAGLIQEFCEAALEHDRQLPKEYLDRDSVYLRLTQALAIYEKKLGTNSPPYQKTYQILSPLMKRLYALEQPLFERLRKHETNNDTFVTLLQQTAQILYGRTMATYEEYDLFRWALKDIKKHHGADDPYYQIVKSIEEGWELGEAEREIGIQKKLVALYRKEYGRQNRLYLEALIKLGNLYAEDGDDVPAEEVFHLAFDQLEVMDELGTEAPEGDQTLLQYYWASVISTWRVILIQEHNMNVMQRVYGLQSSQYWEAYFQLIFERFQQNILSYEKGRKELVEGLQKFPKQHLTAILPWMEKILKLDPESYLDPILRTLPRTIPIPQLEQLLAFPIDSLGRQYDPISVEVGIALEILADAYFYDTTNVAHAAIALAKYEDILEIYQTVGDDYAYTELLDRITKRLTEFSPWTPQQVSDFFEKLLKIKEEDEKDYERYFLTYVERYANWLYNAEQLVTSEQYYERIARYFERENPSYLTSNNKEKANDWYLETLNKLASIYRKTGRYYKAKDNYIKLRRLASSLSSSYEEGFFRVVRAANDIGDLAYRIGQYEEAMAAFDLTLESITMLQADLAFFDTYKNRATALLYVDALQNKGRVHFALDEMEQARLYYNKALDFVEDSRSPISLKEVGGLLVNLANLAVYDYEDEKAAQYYTQALTLVTDREELSKIHIAFAEYYQVIDQDSIAGVHLSAALAIDLRRVQQNYTALSEKERLLFLQPILKRFDIFLAFAVRYDNPQLLRKAFDSHLIIKGLSLETANNLQSVCNVTENTILRTKCIEMQSLRKELSSSTDLPLDIQDNLEVRITELEKDIGLSSKDLREIYDKNNRNLDFVDIKRLLYNMGTPDSLTMAIDFLLVPEKDENGRRQSVYYAAVVIPRHPYPHFVRLATAEELADVLAADVVPNSFNYITETSESQYLYQLVWEPLLPFIKEAKHLHLCPTGILSRIAFGTLQTGDITHKRIMDKWSIHYYGALRDLLHLKADNGPSSSASAILVGGVKFDLTSEELNSILSNRAIKEVPVDPTSIKAGSRGEDFNYLGGTLKEVKAISQLFPNDWVVKLLSGVRATEENLTEVANEAPDILHIATHGYFFPTPPESSKKRGARKNAKGIEDNIAASSNPLLRSGLALTGINRVWKGGPSIEGLEDGILTALEVANLDLFNTKLVVLSACETGRGDINNTEGILGLRRAFKIAGAQQLIISLWKVPDAQTAELMQLFYARYLAGNSAHAAFEFAQKEMSKRYNNPYYWAAFLLIE